MFIQRFSKKILSSRPRRKRICAGFLALSIFIINIKVALIATLFLFFWKNGNTKNQKNKIKFQSFSNIYIIITYTCQNQYSKSCINKPVEHIDHVLSSNFEFPASEADKEENDEIPDKTSHILGILAVEATNKKIVQKRAFTYKDWHEMIPSPHMGIVLQYTFQQGQSPSFPQYTT